MGFFEKKIEKMLFWAVFHIRLPIFQNRDQKQSPWFRTLHKHFIGYILV